MRLLSRTLADGTTELVLRDGQPPNLFEVRAQHMVYAKAQEKLLAKAVDAGVEREVARNVIFAEDA